MRPRILEGAGDRDGGTEWKGRRRQTGNYQNGSGALLHLVFQGIEEFGFHDPREAGFAQVSAD